MNRALQSRILRVLEWSSAYIGTGMAQGIYEGCAVDPTRALEHITELKRELESQDAVGGRFSEFDHRAEILHNEDIDQIWDLVGEMLDHIEKIEAANPPSGTKELMKFYEVSTIPELIDAQAEHIKRLQEQIPMLPDTEPLNYRRG